VTSGQLNAISSTAAGGSTPPAAGEQTTLANTSADIFKTAACIQEQLTSLSGSTNSIHTAQQSLLDLQQQINAAEADVAIARDRVAYIRHPEQNTSYYESWFPIDRPMHSANVPYFVGVTAFVVIFGILVVLSAIGLDINLIVSPTFMAYIQFIVSQFTYLTFLLTIVVIFIIYYFILYSFFSFSICFNNLFICLVWSLIFIFATLRSDNLDIVEVFSFPYADLPNSPGSKFFLT
jgi:hypothetical protein